MIATKGGIRRRSPAEWDYHGHPAYLRRCIDESLIRLRLDTIGVYYLHRIDPSIPVADQVGALATARQDGKILHIGLSKVTLPQLLVAESVAPISAVQNYRAPADPDNEVRRHCQRQGIAYIPYRPLQGRYENHTVSSRPTPTSIANSMRFHLDGGPTTLLIPGTRSVDHLQDDIATYRSVTASLVLDRPVRPTPLAGTEASQV